MLEELRRQTIGGPARRGISCFKRQSILVLFSQYCRKGYLLKNKVKWGP